MPAIFTRSSRLRPRLCWATLVSPAPSTNCIGSMRCAIGPSRSFRSRLTSTIASNWLDSDASLSDRLPRLALRARLPLSSARHPAPDPLSSRPCVSTTPITTSSPRLLRRMLSLSMLKVLPTPGAYPKKSLKIRCFFCRGAASSSHCSGIFDIRNIPGNESGRESARIGSVKRPTLYQILRFIASAAIVARLCVFFLAPRRLMSAKYLVAIAAGGLDCR